MNRRFFLKMMAAIPTMFYAFSVGAKKEKHSEAILTMKNETLKENIINIVNIGAHSCLEKGYADFDNRAIIQKAIDTCSARYKEDGQRWTILIPDGIFMVSSVSFFEKFSNKQKGVCSLILKDNIIIDGTGTIKLLNSQYGRGAFFRVLSSYRESERLKFVDILNIVVDGNSGNQIKNVQASNILLEAKEDIIISGVSSVNSNGNGIQVRGGNEASTAVRNVTVKNCRVKNCSKIGIQIAQFDTLIIEGNDVSFCADNAIDIYGDMGKGTSPQVNGNKFNIFNNKLSACLNGVFPETVANGQIYNNEINEMKESGVHINRIHGLPANIITRNNNISNVRFGVSVTGSMKNIVFIKNNFSNVTSSFISLGGGGGDCSNVFFEHNTLELNGSYDVKLVSLGGNIIRNIKTSNNFLMIHQNLNSKINLNVNDMISNKAKSTNSTVVLDGWVLN